MQSGLVHNYTTYLLSLGDTKLKGATIEGPRLGLCSADVKIEDSLIDTSGKGCPSDYGIGKGMQYRSCAGSGGSNGGRGGYGGLESDNENGHDSCKEVA